MAATYPNALKPMAARLAGYSSQIRRVDPLGKFGGYKAGETAKFILPSNATLDIRTLKKHFKGSTFASTADHGKGVVALPTPIHGLIDQIVVHFNGIQVEATPTNYGFMQKFIDDFTVGREAREARALLQNEKFPGLGLDNELFHTVAAQGTNDPGAVTSLRTGYRDANRPFVIDSFPGCFLGTVQCPVLNTSLTGDIMIEIRFAANSVLTVAGVKGGAPAAAAMTDGAAYPPNAHLGVGKGADTSADPKQYADGVIEVDHAKPTGAYYTVDDLYLTIKSVDIRDGHYYSWLASEIARSPIELTHQSWTMQPGVMTSSLNNTTRMTINTSCTDMLVGTFVADDNQSGLLVSGQDQLAALPKAVGSNIPYDGTWGNSHTNRYFQRGFVATANDDFRSQWSINNVDVGYNAPLADVFGDLKEEWNVGAANLAGMNPRVKNLKNFRQAYFLAPLRLNLKCTSDEKDCHRYLSGLDARGATINLLWKTAGTIAGATNVQPQIWAQSTKVVELKPGQSFTLA